MKLDLDEIINYYMVHPEALARKSKNAKMVEGENTSSVNFGNETFEFGNKLFLARFIYYHNILNRIELYPIIEGVEEPNYPSEKYEKIKYEHCIKVLKTIYGDSYKKTEHTINWGTKLYTIGTYIVAEGQGCYTGGNIFVDIKPNIKVIKKELATLLHKKSKLNFGVCKVLQWRILNEFPEDLQNLVISWVCEKPLPKVECNGLTIEDVQKTMYFGNFLDAVELMYIAYKDPIKGHDIWVKSIPRCGTFMIREKKKNG